MKNLVTVKRVGGGPDCGKLRVIVDVTLSPGEEMVVANATLDAEHQKTARRNLDQPPMRRDVGPVATVVANALLTGLGKVGL